MGFKGETQIRSAGRLRSVGIQRMTPLNAELRGTKTRLAFAGLKFGDAGSIDDGRNYGAIYDVAAYTDMLVEWGGDSCCYRQLHERSFWPLTYRNSDFFGLVDGLSFALQYQGKNDRARHGANKRRRRCSSLSSEYDFGIVLAAGCNC
ncbi:porin [Shigella flexneri]